jgi:signal transduction histidine kinase/ligand-binding sensor domain-containing protein
MFCISGMAYSQFYSPQLSRPTRNNGPETSFPMDIVLDQDYRYWIATYNGLMEYDGKNFRSYHLPLYQDNSLGSDYLFRLLQTNDSTLWIAHSNGIAIFNLYRKTFELVPIRGYKPGASLNFINVFKDSRNKVIFISNELGLLYYNHFTKQVEHFTEPEKAAKGFIFKVTETADKQNYLLHSRNGLILYNIITKKQITQDACPENYRWIFSEELKGSVNDYAELGSKKYISIRQEKDTYYKVLEYSSMEKTFRALPLKSGKGRLFFADSRNHLWLYGFGDQPAVYDPVSKQIFQLPIMEHNASADFSLCYNVMEDHENTIWLCTNAGLFTYDQYQNTSRILSEKNPHNIYSEIAQIGPSTFWFGTIYNGIYEYNTSVRSFRNINFTKLCRDPAYNDIWQIHKSSDNNNIWVLHANAKISRYNIAEKKFYFYKNAPFTGDFISICDNETGDTFLASQNGNIFHYNTRNDNFEFIYHLSGKKGLGEDLEINDILCTSSHELLIGTSGNGLVKLNLNNLSHKVYRFEPGKYVSLRSNIINVLKKFDDEIVYAGTSNGIFSYNTKTDSIESFSYDERFNLGNVFQITQDKNKNLIFTATNKMYLLNWKTKDIVDLGQKSNIVTNNLTEVFYSNNRDKLLVLAEEAIHEISIKDQNFTPQIKPVIYGLESYGKTFFVRNEGEIFLKPSHNSFQISFGSSTYKFRDDLEYYYSLNSSEWLRTEPPYINFSKLPGGNYRFKLKVVYTGNRSLFSETSLTIHIQKKFQETGWFYLLIFLVLSGLFYIFYRFRLKRMLAIEKIRLQLSRDLHDDMGSTLSTINILSSIAAGKLDADPSIARQYMNRISQNSEQMMDSMDDIVWSINPMNDSMNRVIYRMREFASGILEPKGIGLTFDTDKKLNDLTLTMASRRDFYLIFKEAINNAIKYAECSKIKVRFYTSAGNLILVIKDNGKGFEPEKYSDGNGLVNMRKRANAIRAEFAIHSELGAGTTVEIKLKLKEL